MPCDFLGFEQAVEAGMSLTSTAGASLIVTPNVDHFLRWRKDEIFTQVYSQASLSVLDGMPLVWLARISGHDEATRVTGVDLFTALIRKSAENGIAVALIGGRPEVLEQARLRLCEQHPNLDLFLTVSPSPEDLTDPEFISKLARDLQAREHKLVGLCLGSPKQELLFTALEQAGVTGAYIGAGAAVDFLAGNVKRAPSWMQKTGLEWLFRLIQEPGRLWRRYLVDDIGIIPIIFSAAFSRLTGKQTPQERPSSP
jgi:N-acetylglucosaminyldiphosphoundecaprenol N-acetyl-beta-D-mannosaminyltransferase